MSSGNVNAEFINVFARVRASTSTDCNATSSITVVNNKLIQISSNQNREYEFEHVFDCSSMQSDVFDTACTPIIKEVFNGYDCTVLIYGQSGTGKTYTLLGPDDSNEATLGIIQRSFAYIFNNIGRFKKRAMVYVSCLGLVGEELVDMLSDNIDTDVKESTLRMYEDQLRGSVLVEGLKEVTVLNADDVDIVIKQALIKNQKVSKIHMIFTVVVRVREANFNGEEVIKTGKLSFVDLSFSDSNGLKDSNRNMSLFTLRNVVAATAGKQLHIPYRNSKLTRLLQGSINGSGKTTVIATISAASKHVEGTLNTLEFASKVKLIQNYPRICQIIPGNMFINQYTDEIHRLKKNIEASRTGIGINVSEADYNSVLVNINTLKKGLFEKVVINRDAEEEVENKKQEAIRTENTLNKAVKEIEDLILDLQILSTDYETAVQEKNEQEQQLQQTKLDHNRLISDTEVLVCEAQIYSDIESKIHKKITSLYECFQECEVALRDFRPLFDIGNLRIINDMEICITSSRELLENNSDKIHSLNCELERTMYPDVKYDIEKLNMFCCFVLEYVDNYKTLQNSYAETEVDFAGQLKDIEGFFDSMNLSMFETNNKHLYKLNKQITLIEVSWTEMCTTLLNNIRNVDFMVGCCIEETHKIIDQVQETISIQYKPVKEATSEQFKKIVSIMETKKIVDQELENYLNALLISTSECEEYYKANWDEIECNLKESKNVVKDQMESQQDLFEVSNKSIEEIREVSKNCAHIKCDEIDQLLKSSFALKNQEDKFHQNAQKKLEIIANASEQDCQKLEDSFKNTKLLLSNFKSSLNKKEEEENLYFNKVDDVSKRISVNCSSITDVCEDLYNSAGVVHSTLKREFDDTSMKLLKMQADYHQHDSQVVKVVNKFCKQELQHPNHAGDTPRRPQRLRLITTARPENNNE